MGGVNGAVDYYQNTMKFGKLGPDGPIYEDTLLQGGIVCARIASFVAKLFLTCPRSPSTTLVPSWAASWVDGLVINMAGSRRSRSGPFGPSSALLSKPLLKTILG